MALMLTTNAELVARVLRGEEPSMGGDGVAALAATRSLVVIVEDILRALVSEERAAGRTWAEIGLVLQVSRQAAFQRFGDTARAVPATAAGPAVVAGAAGKAVTVVEQFLAGEWERMRADFDDRMRQGCSTELLASVRTSLAAGLGEFVELGEPAMSVRVAHTMVDVPLVFAEGQRVGRVALNAAAQIAGFFILEAP